MAWINNYMQWAARSPYRSFADICILLLHISLFKPQIDQSMSWALRSISDDYSECSNLSTQVKCVSLTVVAVFLPEEKLGEKISLWRRIILHVLTQSFHVTGQVTREVVFFSAARLVTKTTGRVYVNITSGNFEKGHLDSGRNRPALQASACKGRVYVTSLRPLLWFECVHQSLATKSDQTYF